MTLKELMDELDVLKITNNGKSLIVAKHNGMVSFHVSGAPESAVKHESEYCSPNAVADIVMNKLGFPLTCDEVVNISNWC